MFPPSIDERAVVFSDVHFPYQDRYVWDSFLEVISRLNADYVIANGDIFDIYACSSYDKDPRRKLILEDEMQEGVSALAELQESSGAARWEFILGNHEARLYRELAKKMPELQGLMRNWRDIAGLEHWDRITDYTEYIEIGDVIFTHDVGHAGKTTAQRSLDTAGRKVVVGHSHRGGVHYGGAVGHGEPVWCLNTGHMSDVSMAKFATQYQKKDWVHGFGIVDFRNGNGVPHFIPHCNGEMRCERFFC